MSLLEKIEEFLDGKKTYIIAILIGLGSAATALGYVIPEWVWAALGALGLGAVRSSIGSTPKS